MKNKGSLLPLKPEREDFYGWKISVVKKNGKEVEPMGKGPNTQYQSPSEATKQSILIPLLSLSQMILDGQQPCPAGFIAPPMHRQASPYPAAFPSFPAGTSMAPSFATRASSVALCLRYACGHGGLSLMPSLLVASSVPAVYHQLTQCCCGQIQPACEDWH